MTPEANHTSPPKVTLRAYGLLIVALMLTGVSLYIGVTIGETHWTGILQISASLILGALLLRYSRTLLSSPLISIALACFGWEFLFLPYSVSDLIRSDSLQGCTSFACQYWDGHAMPGAIEALLALNVLALILVITVSCRRPSFGLPAAMFVCVSLLAALTVWEAVSLGL
jgi:hypothetical protein